MTETLQGGLLASLPYVDGPGKFEGEPKLTEKLYELSMEGGADEEITVGDGEWFGMFKYGPSLLKSIDLHPAEVAFLRKAIGGVILENTNQGFVIAHWFDSKEKIENDWSALQTAAYELYTGEDHEC